MFFHYEQLMHDTNQCAVEVAELAPHDLFVDPVLADRTLAIFAGIIFKAGNWSQGVP